MAEAIWLASYPKSGNTWLRALLTAYGAPPDADDPVALDRLNHGMSARSVQRIGKVLGVDPTLFDTDELLALVPTIHRTLARNARERDAWIGIKVHMANIRTPGGERAFPEDAGRAVYIVRNPLDVAASWAPFFGVSLDRSVETLGRPFVLNAWRDRPFSAFPEPLLDWSGHVRSWLDEGGPPTHLVRYEDLQAGPAGTFTGVLRFIGERPDADRVRAAVETTRFDRLREREDAAGFREHAVTATAPFFRKGRAGGWRDDLSPEQAARIVAAHAPTMRQVGYGSLVDEIETW